MRLYNADCMDVLKSIEDNSIDLVLTDPPYDHNNSGGGSSALGGRTVKLKQDINFMSHSFDMGGSSKNYCVSVRYQICLYFVQINRYLK